MTNPTRVSLPVAAMLAAALLALLVPAPLLAWTPGTHVFLGDAVLRSTCPCSREHRGAAGRVPI